MAARKAKRPMRPIPLMPTFMANPSMVLEMSISELCHGFVTIL
jgi:hypothetical protein